jgi:hypothetical protein
MSNRVVEMACCEIKIFDSAFFISTPSSYQLRGQGIDRRNNLTMARINDWRGGSIEVAHSGGGVRAVVDPWKNVITTGIRPWPAPELIQKIYQSRQIRAFSGDDQQLATATLGFYADLQSIHNEDAITWSVFGPVLYASAEVREPFVADLLRLIRMSGFPSNARVWLWRRLLIPIRWCRTGPRSTSACRPKTFFYW